MKHYKKAILNVSDKDSPYALIDKYFPERESYFYQNRNKFLSEFRDSGRGGGGADIGDLDPSEVSAVMLTIDDRQQRALSIEEWEGNSHISYNPVDHLLIFTHFLGYDRPDSTLV